MQKGHQLEFTCCGCKNEVAFSLFEIEKGNHLVKCSHCGKGFSFDDETLLRQLKKFEKLCMQIRDSEEILGRTSVGIDVNGHSVQIPFKLLLTRLSSTLDLLIGDQPLSIHFRIEPAADLSETLLQN